jgi:hypothetical protein
MRILTIADQPRRISLFHRALRTLIADRRIERSGQGRATRYSIRSARSTSAA